MIPPLSEHIVAEIAHSIHHPLYLMQKKEKIPEDIKKIFNPQTAIQYIIHHNLLTYAHSDQLRVILLNSI